MAKKVNDTRGLIFSMNTDMIMLIILAKNYGLGVFIFLQSKYHIFCTKHVILNIWPNNEMGALFF